ncbi:MAG TPA: hypothetical protein VJK02_15785 [Anaerolineales bacterium]|nr:hypothetical protein [Anaerolineales bacterium]
MTDDLLDLLMDLLRLPGISGHEGLVAARLQESWAPLVDELHVDLLGNLVATRNGVTPGPRPTMLITAHMDSVGFIVRGILDGFVQVSQVGRFDDRLLPGQSVTVHGARPIPGLIVAPARAGLPEKIGGGVVPTKYLLVDLGLPAGEIQRVVKVGDSLSFDNPPRFLADDVICGHSLDNRASLAALEVCLKALAGIELKWDLVMAATVQEETTAYGAQSAGHTTGPAAAIVVDVTYGRAYAEPENESFPLGGGPTNAWSAEVHPGVYREIEAAAERAGVALTREILPSDTGTEARGILIGGAGIPLGVLSIPLRYMHNPVEVVMLSDIRQTGLLLAEVVAGLDDEFLRRLALD